MATNQPADEMVQGNPMNIYKANNSLAVIFTLALVLGNCLAAQSPASPPAPATAPQTPDIHTIKSAGLQFELPKGWKAETQENGNVFLTVEDGAGTVTFVVEDDYAEIVTGMKSGLKERLTDLKFEGEPKQDTHNDMVHISETGTGLMEKVKITWSIDVLKATKNVTMLTFGVESVLQSHIDEYEKFVKSLKKI